MTMMDALRRADEAVTFRSPRAEDGPAVTGLIAASPPLDPNSAYCNLLQCTHFAATCVVAEMDGAVAGWISGYRIPEEQDCYFLWQVAVASSARGKGLAGRMLDALFARQSMQGVSRLKTTVTQDNEASWALFRAFAQRHGAGLKVTPCFDRDLHFGGQHASEWQAEIGPIALAV